MNEEFEVLEIVRRDVHGDGGRVCIDSGWTRWKRW